VSGARWELVAIIEIEAMLGLALVLGLYSSIARWFALGVFALFAAVKLYQVVAGVRSCGCFGRFQVHPAWTLGLDLFALAALICWRPATKPAPSTEAVISLPLVGASLLSLLLFAPTTGRPDNLDTPGRAVALDAGEWVGRRFPLLDRLTDGRELARGRWVVVFHRQGCEACEALLDEFRQGFEEGRSAVAGRLACVEVPSGESAQAAEVPSCCKRLRLLAGREWMMKTPTCVRLLDGRTDAVTTDAQEARRWLRR
jgi:hypothetical protein